MTDSSSEVDMVLSEKAIKSMMAGGDAGKNGVMTHLLRIGTFQLEVAPNENVDVRAFFNETLDKLIEAYGDRLLEIDVKGLPVQTPTNMHG
jgi:hypothetical protein|tara:strand:- start:4431 stop:4703 length:273 start_codon:yes stop_codon:yes gene_type:complete